MASTFHCHSGIFKYISIDTESQEGIMLCPPLFHPANTTPYSSRIKYSRLGSAERAIHTRLPHSPPFILMILIISPPHQVCVTRITHSKYSLHIQCQMRDPGPSSRTRASNADTQTGEPCNSTQFTMHSTATTYKAVL